MTALYCYIFHPKKFTKKEFQQICNEIKDKIITKDKENPWRWEYPSTFIEYAKEYGFREVDVLEVDTIDFKVESYLEY